jgi:hypothetical protein
MKNTLKQHKYTNVNRDEQYGLEQMRVVSAARFTASAAVTGCKHLRGRITTRYGKGRGLGNFIIL